jgi:hypothetical protein
MNVTPSPDLLGFFEDLSVVFRASLGIDRLRQHTAAAGEVRVSAAVGGYGMAANS